MLLQTCRREKRIGTILGSWKSVHIFWGKSSPAILILSGSEQPKPICLAVLIMGTVFGSIPISLAHIVSQAIGSVPPMSQPRGLVLPRIGPEPSIAMTASMIVKAGFKSLNMSISNSQKS